MNRLTGFSLVMRRIIRDRAGDCCELCGYYASDCTAHHRRPRGAGGSKRSDTNLPSNALWVCNMCHLKIESYRSTSYTNGWLVYQSGQPASVPVLRRGEWVLLGDDGSVVPHDIPSIESAAQGVKSDEAARCVNTVRPLTDPLVQADRTATDEW